MANPRQRRKTRSSTHRAVSHSKHAQRNLKKMPNIRAPKVLQQAWDKHKTVRQNYVALGLIHDLNPSESGGAEIIELDEQAASGNAPGSFIDLTAPSTSTKPSSMAPDMSLSEGRSYASNSADASRTKSKSASVPKGHGRIVRDDAGNVLRVELAEEDLEVETSIPRGNMDMEQLEAELDGKLREKWVSDLGRAKSRSLANNTDVVKELEALSTLASPSVLKNRTTLSASLTGVGSRHSSDREVAYLQRLMEKHGVDVQMMARDRKLNSSQKTAAQLAHALKRAGLIAQ